MKGPAGWRSEDLPLSGSSGGGNAIGRSAPPVGPRQRRGLQEEWIQLFPFSFLLVSLSFQILFGFKEDGDVLLLFFSG